MNWKRFFALLLVLALLPALFGNAFAAGPKARTLTDADYAPIDALWAELDAVEQDAQTQSAQDGPDRTLAAAQAVAEAVTASDLYVDGTLQWRGAQFSFETTTGVTCAYSPRLRELARKAAGSSVETEAVEPQTSTTTSADIAHRAVLRSGPQLHAAVSERGKEAGRRHGRQLAGPQDDARHD